MPEVITRTIRESLTFIENAGGIIRIRPAPRQNCKDDTFFISLRVNDKYSGVILFDIDTIRKEGILENCLDTFCNAIIKNTKEKKR